jgi:thioredoxin 2
MTIETATHVLLRCPNCGAQNRVAADRVQQQTAVCGKCKTPLTLSLHPQTMTDANFAELTAGPLPVLVDCWAPWCGPCRMIAPVIEELAKEFVGRAQVGKLNTDENPQTARRFNIQSIPTLLILKDGREVERLIGVQPKTAIAQQLQRWL